MKLSILCAIRGLFLLAKREKKVLIPQSAICLLREREWRGRELEGQMETEKERERNVCVCVWGGCMVDVQLICKHHFSLFPAFK